MKRRCQGQHGPRVPSRPAVREAPFLQVDGLPKGRHPGQFVDHNMQGRRIGHRRQEPVWTSECGAGVKAVSPAKRGRSGATRLDTGEHTRTLRVRRCPSTTQHLAIGGWSDFFTSSRSRTGERFDGTQTGEPIDFRPSTAMCTLLHRLRPRQHDTGTTRPT